MGMNAELRLVDGGIGKVILNHILEALLTLVVDDVVLNISSQRLAEQAAQKEQKQDGGKSSQSFHYGALITIINVIVIYVGHCFVDFCVGAYTVLRASIRACIACEHMRDAKLRIFLYVAKFL